MSFIEVPIADGVEKSAVPEGAYQVVIAKVDPYRSDAGNDSIRCILEIEGQPEAAAVFHYLSLPNDTDESDKRNTKLVMMKQFLEIMGVPFEGNGFNTEDLLGASAKVYLNNQLDNNDVPRNGVTFKKV